MGRGRVGRKYVRAIAKDIELTLYAPEYMRHRVQQNDLRAKILRRCWIQ